MGFSYLGGRLWSEVTRDERFFCQRLYSLASADPTRFVATLNQLSPELKLDQSLEWEVAFEVCFFRDIRHLRGKHWDRDLYFSPKRTFDLCLFSEPRIIIIEAKAQQSFESNAQQLRGFAEEPKFVQQIVGKGVDVSVLTLAAGRYLTAKVRAALMATFKIEPVSWADLAKAYGGDPVLERAEAAYERVESGLNNEKSMSGNELLAAYKAGTSMLVGRSGGLGGVGLREDFATGAWRSRSYETRGVGLPPNANWFTLDEFVALVRTE